MIPSCRVWGEAPYIGAWSEREAEPRIFLFLHGRGVGQRPTYIFPNVGARGAQPRYTVSTYPQSSGSNAGMGRSLNRFSSCILSMRAFVVSSSISPVRIYLSSTA